MKIFTFNFSTHLPEIFSPLVIKDVAASFSDIIIVDASLISFQSRIISSSVVYCEVMVKRMTYLSENVIAEN